MSHTPARPKSDTQGTTDEGGLAPDEKASTLDALMAQRLRKKDDLTALTGKNYANDFRVNCRVVDFHKRFGQADMTEHGPPEPQYALAGRIVAINTFGKAAFIRLQDGSADEVAEVYTHADEAQKPHNSAASMTATSTLSLAHGQQLHAPSHAIEAQGQQLGLLQLYVRRDQVDEASWQSFKLLDLGDIVGVRGSPMRTKTGELTLSTHSLHILVKTMRPPPEKWHGLADQEKRHRQRYLDLIANAQARRVFSLRARILRWLRNYLEAQQFVEVETPMMQTMAGGASARPFITHHNTLDLPLFLRVAPELFLKRLLVGGMERVFEINRNFRNEGISTFHNPEFTMLECYQAYATYEDMMAHAEAIVVGLGQDVVESLSLPWGDNIIELTRPFKRMTMLEAIAAYGGPNAADFTDLAAIKKVCASVGLHVQAPTWGGHVVALFEHFAEAKLIQPTFITDFPADVSPLARRKDDLPHLVDRFELFVGGRELGNAFSELNDPQDQRVRFAEQAKQKHAGDAEAHGMDDDYVRALEHGLPPCAGFGLGIDRLVMLMSNQLSIREVILFPLLRPEH